MQDDAMMHEESTRVHMPGSPLIAYSFPLMNSEALPRIALLTGRISVDGLAIFITSTSTMS